MTDLQSDPISADLPCFDCGYNLRGLQEDGRCPECGESIRAAIAWRRRNRLDPQTATMLRRAIDGLLLTLVWPIIGLVVTMCAGLQTMHVVIAAGGILCAVSCWALTSRSGEISIHRSVKWIRPALRIASLAFAALYLVLWISRPTEILIGSTLIALTMTAGLALRHLELLAVGLRESRVAETVSFAKKCVTSLLGAFTFMFFVVAISALSSLGFIATGVFAFLGFMQIPAWIVALVALYETRQMFRSRQRQPR